jgi:type II secretory pathway component PulF
MSLYHYRACDAAGQTVSGSLEGGSVAAVEHHLRRSGVWLLEARKAGPAGPVRIRGVKVKRSELIGFFVEMSLLLQARIPLPKALHRLAADLREGNLFQVIRALHEQVTAGVPLHQAMAAQPRVFSPQVVAMVQAGELSGKLPEVFESLTAYLQWLDQLAADMRQALIYPLVVSGATLALVIGLFTFIVPHFVELLQGFAMQVPLPTRIAIAISGLLLRGWPFLLAGAVGGPLALKFALRSRPFARAFDRALLRLPVFGPLLAMFALSRFTQNLGMLYRAGIPLLRSLEICGHLVGNRAIAQALEEVQQGVAAGTPLSQCLSRHDFFPPMLVTMIAGGESSGNLAHSLQSVGDYYNKIIPRRIKVVFSIFEPTVMLVLTGVVGGVALAVVLPILQLWQVR